MSRVALFLVSALGVVSLAGCSLVFPITDPLAGATVDAHAVLITGGDVSLLDGTTAGEATEPFASAVDDYLALHATGIAPIEPEECGDAVVDLVLLDRDAGAAGTIYAAPRLVLPDGYELVQTGREFPSTADAEAWFDDYRELIESCRAFVVHDPSGDVVVTQKVSDAGYEIDGFVVRLEIDGPDSSPPTYNEQWMLRDGPFAVLLSAQSADGEDDAMLPAVDLVHERLVDAVATADAASDE